MSISPGIDGRPNPSATVKAGELLSLDMRSSAIEPEFRTAHRAVEPLPFAASASDCVTMQLDIIAEGSFRLNLDDKTRRTQMHSFNRAIGMAPNLWTGLHLLMLMPQVTDGGTPSVR